MKEAFAHIVSPSLW
jgi:hypothetical protein